MSLRKLLCVVGVLAGLLISPAPLAAAGDGWPWPVTGARSLGFGMTYDAPDGSSNVHGGLDIVASAGERVRACASGEVVFAGKVPAGEGAQAFAVTVLTSEGLRVTLLPLGSVAVTAGSSVKAGDPVGVLAPAGDASSGATHLHLGVKRGSTRLDPAAFLSAGVAAAQEAPKPSHSAAPSAARSAAAPAVPRPLPGHASAPAPVSAAAAAPAAVPARPHATYRDVVASATDALSTALSGVPRLRRIPTVRTVHTLSLSRLWHDITDLQGTLGRVVLSLTLALVSAGCAIAAVRSAGQSARGVSARLAPVREERS